MGDEGLEKSGKSSRDSQCLPATNVSDNVNCGDSSPSDPDLRRLTDAWPDLPEARRQSIVALLDAWLSSEGEG
jgi:hypothetical protein